MVQTSTSEQIAQRYARVRASLNERARRLFVASEAVAQGYGGISRVSRATGVARRTIGVGIAELQQIEEGWTPPWGPQRVRKPGAGRKKTTAKDPTLLSDLHALVESTTRGDPESPLAAHEPAISVDTKKKELVGLYKNGAANCARKALPTTSRCMTSSARRARRRRTACTTCRRTTRG